MSGYPGAKPSLTKEQTMEQLITVAWDDHEGRTCFGDAIVEYVEYLEEGEIVKEIINIFLPEFVPVQWVNICKRTATSNFQSG
jgi:hypothetical protein